MRSSLARRLGLPDAAIAPEDRRADGIIEMTLDATLNCSVRLTRERLFAWQAALFPTGRSGLYAIRVGAWRNDAKGPMQVVSGPVGLEKIHFQAPPADRVDAEMSAFIDWFHRPPEIDGILHAAIAHLWFVTIHPFEDGNGRIARVLADMSLACSETSPRRFYSLSGQIRRDRSSYYGSLERTQKGDLDITARLLWFVDCFSKAIGQAESVCFTVLDKSRFWQQRSLMDFNERQKAMLNRVLDGFEGHITARKWAALAKCSQDTALRDILFLIDHGIRARGDEGGRSTGYRLTLHS